MPRFSLKKLTKKQKEIRRKILEVSFENGLSHIGSCLSASDLIESVYSIKKHADRFILSNGHAGIALYTILNKHGYIPDEKIIKNLHIHPDRSEKLGIYVSSGSLGQGLPIAIGMALADKKKSIYCMISDGECAEGSIWESLRIAVDRKVDNLKIIVNVNGWGAYDTISSPLLIKRLRSFGGDLFIVDGHNISKIKQILRKKTRNKPLLLIAKTASDQLPFLHGQDAHYYTMTEENYKDAIKLLQ